jgi:DNA-binding NarL/FixJ family response regulator
MRPELITLIIADDHEITRDGISTMLRKFKDIEIVAEASNGQQLIQLAERYLPNVILTDIQMPIMNGIEATRILTKRFPAIAVIALSMMDSPFLISEMMHAGANGYLLKGDPKDEIIEGIRAVSKNRDYFSSGASQKIAGAIIYNPSDAAGSVKKIRFTKRQKELLKLLCEGLSTRKISKSLFLSPKTIENYRSNLLAKTGCKNAPELAFFIAKNGLDYMINLID